jgi:threonylcarbamoyladenosine tRNA methylthiotransferase MtaB
MAADTLALIDDCDIVHAHIFPYSPRAGTPAARMPQVEPEVRRERAARLRAASAARKSAWLQGLVGTVQDVLLERPGDRGHTPGFAEVRLPSVRPEPIDGRPVLAREECPSTSSGRTGEVVSLSIHASTSTDLVGEAA